MRITLMLALAASLVACNKDADNDEDGFPASEDCNDEDASINPDADEVCDLVDNNCDAITDVDAIDAVEFYGDADGDGFGGDALTFMACEAPEGFFATNDDCDDTNADVNPDGLEICDGLDNDCDGALDDADDSVDLSTITDWYPDFDGDGYGDDSAPVQSCSAPAGHVIDGGDCDDIDPLLNPETVWYADVDGDGYGSNDFTTIQCEQPNNHTFASADCDDSNPNINPDALEVCDAGADNDCDGLIDDDDDSLDLDTRSLWYPDADADGYGDDQDAGVLYCNGPSGTANNAEDCDDVESTVSPDATEICEDGLDNDCSGDAPECGLTGAVTLGDADMVISGPTSSEKFGYRFAVLDADGDGNDDLFIGDYWDDTYAYDAGTVFGIHGPITGDISASSADWSVSGSSSSNKLGYNLASAGDMDGDGYDDLLVGEHESDDYLGHAYVYFGSTTGLSSTPAITISGQSTYDDFAEGLAGVGDIDGDGYNDIAIGATYNDNAGTSSGAAYVFFGLTSGEVSADDADVIVSGDGTYNYIGDEDSISSGDFDGDGSDDLIVGGYGANSYYGGVFVNYGPMTTGTSMSVSDSDVNISGSASYDYMGLETKSGDLNGDGYDDLVASEYSGVGSSGSSTGAVYVFHGSSSAWSGEVSLADADIMLSGAASSDSFGRSLAVEDFNADGNLDLLIGAPYNDDTASSAGKVYGFMGPITSGSSLNAGTDEDLSITGSASSDYCGLEQIGGGDLDGDGSLDFLIPCYGYGSDGALFVFGGGGM